MIRNHLPFFLFWLTLPAAWGQGLSLAEATEHAFKNAPAFRNAVLDEAIRDRQLAEAKTRYLPTVNATLDFRNNIRRQTIVLPNLLNPNGSPDQLLLVQQGARYLATAALDANWTLFDASANADIRAARVNGQVARNATEQNRTDLRIDVARAYYAALLDREKRGQARTNAERNEHFYRDQQVKFDNQQVLKTDLNRAYLNYANARLDRDKTEDAYRVSLLNLKNVIGMEEDRALELTDSLVVMQVDSAEVAAVTLEPVLERRASYRAGLLQKRVSELNLQKTRLGYYPVFSLYGYAAGLGQTDALGEFAGGDNVWFPWVYAGARLTVPLFDGTQKRTAIRRQRLELERRENTLLDLRQDIHYELTNTATQLQHARKAVDVQRENLGIANQVVQQTKIRHAQALATTGDVLDAEATLRDTQLNYLQALHDLMIARLEWERATGK